VSLVRQHRLPIDKSLVVVLVMERRSCWSTAANGEIRLNAPNVVVLLTTENEEALKLALAHAWLTVLHDVAVGLGGNLSSPAQSKDLLIVLNSARLAQDVVHRVIVNTKVRKVRLLRDLCLELAIAIDTTVDVNSRVCAGRTRSRQVLL